MTNRGAASGFRTRAVGMGVMIVSLLVPVRGNTQSSAASSSAPLRTPDTLRSASLFPISAAKAPFGVERVSSDKMPVPGIASPLDALQGKVAGLAVQPVSGQPGVAMSIQLRSPLLLADSSGPLYVVDGVLLNLMQQNPLQDIDPQDVAGIEIIKGLAGAALYGAQGRFGVIAISTHRGRRVPLGKLQFTVRNEFGHAEVADWYEPPLAHQYRVNALGQFVNASGAVVPRSQRVLSANGIMETPYVVPTYDHASQFFRPGLFNTQTVAVARNSAATNFNLQYSRNSQAGTVPYSTGYNRQSFRANADARFRSWLQFGVSATHATSNDDLPAVAFLNLATLAADVNLRLSEASGKAPFGFIVDSATDAINPLNRQVFNDNVDKRARTTANATVSIRPFSFLSIDATESYDRGRSGRTNYVPIGTPNLNGRGVSSGILQFVDDTSEGQRFQGGLTLTRSVRELTARLGARAEAAREWNGFNEASAAGLRPDSPRTLDSAQSFATTRRYFTNTVKATLANLGLDYKGRYIGDVGYRQEKDGQFPVPDGLNTFVRSSAAWLMNEEPWFPFRRISLVKLRYSVVSTHTQPMSGIQFTPLGGSVTGASGAKLDRSSEHEVGMDVALADRLQLSLARASVHSRGKLFQVFGNAVLSNSFATRANGETRSNSTEASLFARVLTNPGGLQWEVVLVADHRESRIGEFPFVCTSQAVRRPCANSSTSELWGDAMLRDKAKLAPNLAGFADAFDVNDEGYVVPVGTGNTWRDGKARNLWGTTVRVNGQNLPWGLPMVERDDFGQTVFQKIGNANPAMRYGFQNTFRYKGVRVYGQFTGQIGGDVYNDALQSLCQASRQPGADQTGKPDELRKPVAYYRAVAADNAVYLEDFVESGTHMRLAEASVGYELRAERFGWLNRIGAKRMQIDVVGRNVFTLSRSNGLNPGGVGNTGIDSFAYPLSRTFTLATSIVF